MALIVFMRGVNVGKHKRFSTSALAKDLSAYDVISIGAAGTFVVRGKVSQAVLRAEIAQKLPFDVEIMICSSDEILGLLRDDLFGPEAKTRGVEKFVSLMAKAPRTVPALPIREPSGNKWEVTILQVSGKCALSLWRRSGPNILYPNKVVERQFGIATTT